MSVSNSEFLTAAYGPLENEYGWTASFVSDPNDTDPSVWSGSAYMATTAQRSLIDQRISHNNFFCVSVMEEQDKKKRSKDGFRRLAVLLADDANPDELYGTPSYILETSPGNFQIGILIDPGDPDACNQPLIEALLKTMAAANLINADSSGNNIVRYGRLPVGQNTKQRESGAFATKVHQADLTVPYSLADAAAAFGLDLEEIRSGTLLAPLATKSLDKADGSAVDLYRSLINPNLEERSYHDPLLRLSSAMVAAGMERGAVVNNLRSLMLAIQPELSGSEYDRWYARYGSELSRMVASAEKYAPTDRSWDAGLSGRGLLLSLDELMACTKDVRWLVKNLIPEDGMGMIFGASGTYKSFIAIDLALHVATGADWADKRTKHGPVVYVAAEGGAGISRRLDAWKRSQGLAESPDNLWIVVKPLLLSDEQDVMDLQQGLSALPQKPSLIIIDTLSQTFDGDENSSKDISYYIRLINSQIRAAFNCTVIIIHHTGHSAKDRPRGSSAITANMDFILGVNLPDPSGLIARLSVEKMKDGEKLNDLFFEMSRTVLGVDEDGDEITTLIANHTRNAPLQVQLSFTDEDWIAIIALVKKGNYRAHPGSSNQPYIGKLFAERLGLDLSRKDARTTVETLIAAGLCKGYLAKTEQSLPGMKVRKCFVIAGDRYPGDEGVWEGE